MREKSFGTLNTIGVLQGQWAVGKGKFRGAGYALASVGWRRP